MHDLPFGCMNEAMGFEIGNTIGKVQECDIQADRTGWGKALQVRIELDLQKPIY